MGASSSRDKLLRNEQITRRQRIREEVGSISQVNTQAEHSGGWSFFSSKSSRGVKSIKSVKSVSIMFPLIIALCIPVRLYLMPKIFSPAALVLIDGDDDEIRAFDGGAAAARKKRRSDIDSNPPSMYPSAVGGDAPPALTLAPAVSPRETERVRETSLGIGYQDGDASMTASAHHAV